MSVLIVAENHNGALNPSASHIVKAAVELSSEINVLVMGSDCEAIAAEAAKLAGVSKVLVAKAPQFEHAIAENTAEQVLSIAKNYTHILFNADPQGKAAAPRVAARLDCSQISEIIKIIDQNTFKHPIYAGSAIEQVHSLDPIKVLTVRPTVFDPVENTGSAAIEEIPAVAATDKVSFVSREKIQSNRPELQSAKYVIAGGRGLADESEFVEMEKLADKIGGAVGTTRAVVDAGMAPNDWQVGQTGKIIAPDLYIAIGISGAIQHIAGIKDAKVIVAVNKDPEAPIFEVADYGLVADAMDTIRQLYAKL